LTDQTGVEVWRTEPFHAWDSAETPQLWDNPVTSFTYVDGQIVLVLEEKMLATASYPLYLDPTWTLSSSLGWGASTFQDAVEDKGDHNIKIGWFADNFNDNTNEGQWVVESGSVTFATGVMQLGTSTTVKLNLAGSNLWADYRFAYKIRFTQAGGTAQAYFRYADANNHYYLDMSELGDTLTLKKKFAGTLFTVATIPGVQILTNTDYTAKLRVTGSWVAGASLEVWWQGALKWSGTDNQGPGAPATGYIKFATNSVAKANIDDVRVWNTALGTMTTAVRNAGAGYHPTQTKIVGSVDAFNQTHVRIQSSPDNTIWGSWTNLKSDMASTVFYKVPDQDTQRYYKLKVTLTSGTDGTPALSELTTTEDNQPLVITPTSNTGFEPWYPYVGGLANAITGNVWYSATDTSMSGRAFSLFIQRSYNSLRGSEAGPLGNGWTSNYNVKLVVNGDLTVTWNDPDGSQQTFTPKGSTGGYAAPRGVPSRLVKNGDGSFTLWRLDGTRESFDSSGKLTYITDKNGNKVTMTYASGRLSTVSDDAGKSLTFTYDGSGRITSIRDPMNRYVNYSYDGSSNLIQRSDPMGFLENYTYSAGKLASIVDPVGKRTSFVYDGSSRATEIWLGFYQAGSVVWQFRQYAIAYTSSSTRTITNARSFTTTITLNSFGNPTNASGPSIGCAACDSHGNWTAYRWDGEMNQIKITDGRVNSWSQDFDHRSRLVSRTDPGGNVSYQTWTEVNNVTTYVVVQATSTSYRGFTTTFGHDWKGNLVGVTDPGGNITQLGYDSSGFLNKTVSARGYTTWFVYNTSGWLVKVTDPLNDVTQYAYDVLGRRTSVTSPLNFVTTTVYDRDSRIVNVTDPKLNSTTFAYNPRGDLLQVTDPDGLSTAFSINTTNGRNQVVTDSGQNTTRYGYDLRGNVASVKDGNQHTTTFQYDSFDRLKNVTTPLQYVTSYVYDGAGNKISRTDGNGYTTKYGYDKINRLATVSYPGQPVYPSPQTVSYSYDKDGNLASTTGFGYTETRSYDKLDRPYSSNVNYGSFTSTVAYTYDKDGNRATMSLQDPSGTSTTTYYYDRAERLTGEKDASGHNTTYSYDSASRRTATIEPGGVTNTFVYDAADRVKSIYMNNSGGTAESLSYTYDKAGYATSVTDVGSNTVVTTYTYDRNHRLNKTVQGTSTTWDAYDAVGNPTRETTPAVETYVYDADNELMWANASTGGGWYYTYDRDGNRVSQSNGAHGGTTAYTYDYENRLIGIVRGIITVCSYTYAPTGERISDSCGSAPNYAYDIATPGGASNLIADYSSSGSRQDQYIHGDRVDSPVEMVQGSSYYSYQVDRLGSVRRITDINGNTVNTYNYDSWGNPTQSGTVANPFQYTAREYDSSAGLCSYRARFYDPSAARRHGFLSQDPVGGGYAYVGDSPANFADPTGRCPRCRGGGGGGGGNPAPISGGYNWQKCAGPLTLWVAGIVLAIAGLYYGDLAKLQLVAYRLTGISWNYDLLSILTSHGDLWSVLQIVFDIGSFIIFDVLIPGMAWWEQALTIGVEAAEWTPPGIAIHIPLAIASAVIGYIGLQSEGCGWPPG
jgi:RHS repeat-associated protein